MRHENNLPFKQTSIRRKVVTICIIMLTIALYVWMFIRLDIAWGQLWERMTKNMHVIIPQLFRPEWATAEKVLIKMAETMMIAFTSTLMAAILSIPLGLLATSSITNRYISALFRFILSANRAFPELILAILFVVAVGPNALAGVLAITIHSTGMLGKLYADAMEEIDEQIIDMMKANGANNIQILMHGIMPQVKHEFLSLALYRFEINIRSSSVLGIVGAGGIGTMVMFASMNRNWSEMGMILLVIIVVVLLIDYVSAFIRKKLV